jgi:hypothetical protein
MELVYDVAGNDVSDIVSRMLECDVEPNKCLICGKIDNKSHNHCKILSNKLKKVNYEIEKLTDLMFELKFALSLLKT